MIENQTDKYQDAYQKALSNIQDPTDVQKKALEYGEELEKTIKNIILFFAYTRLNFIQAVFFYGVVLLNFTGAD